MGSTLKNYKGHRFFRFLSDTQRIDRPHLDKMTQDCRAVSNRVRARHQLPSRVKKTLPGSSFITSEIPGIPKTTL